MSEHIPTGRIARSLYWGIFSVCVATPWLATPFPLQDFPQHLAYVRIIEELGSATGSAIRNRYEAIGSFQPYFTGHYFLLTLSRLMNLETAAKLGLSLYIGATLLSFRLLVRRVWPDETSDARAALGVPIVFNPALFMGFWAFCLAIPFLLTGCAFLLGDRDQRRIVWPEIAVALCALGAALVHPVASGCFLFICLANALAHRQRKSVLSAFLVLFVTAAVQLVFRRSQGYSAARIDWHGAWQRSFGADFLTSALSVQWSDLPAKLNFTYWTLLGPFCAPYSIPVVGSALFLVVVLLWAHRTALVSRSRIRAVTAAMFLLCVVTPWGLFIPTEISFLDFRLFPIAAALCFCALPSGLFARTAVRGGAFAYAAGFAVVCALSWVGFAREVNPLLALLSEIAPGKDLLPVLYGNRSRYFSAQFAVSHFVPMYYTIRHGGFVTQFWGAYTHHLPVAYKAGKRIGGASDWKPELLDPRALAKVDYILFQDAPEDGTANQRFEARRARRVIDGEALLRECRAAWCIYEVRSPGNGKPHDANL